MGGSSPDLKDLNPWSEFIKDVLIPQMGDIIGTQMPDYGGDLSAGRTPMEDFALQLAGRRAMGGQPEAWGQASEFMNPGMADYMASELAGQWNQRITNPYESYLQQLMTEQGMGPDQRTSESVWGAVDQSQGFDPMTEGAMYDVFSNWGTQRDRNPGVDQFINTYLNAYPQGWNPYSGIQPGNTGMPPWGQ